MFYLCANKKSTNIKLCFFLFSLGFLWGIDRNHGGGRGSERNAVKDRQVRFETGSTAYVA